jgi:hypothetical protein
LKIGGQQHRQTAQGRKRADHNQHGAIGVLHGLQLAGALRIQGLFDHHQPLRQSLGIPGRRVFGVLPVSFDRQLGFVNLLLKLQIRPQGIPGTGIRLRFARSRSRHAVRGGVNARGGKGEPQTQCADEDQGWKRRFSHDA